MFGTVMEGPGDKAGKIMQEKTLHCITLLLRANTKLRRKNTKLEENIVFGYIPNMNSGKGKRGGECLKQECEGGCSRSE